ncbi:MAG: hypothetical protein JHD16_18250, partial [Solirubrobacteraceae bacterium]|nr:hypothetical protein [Solirubrobacteraceae bacterium]
RSCKNVFSFFIPGFYRQECRAPEPTVAPVGDFNGDGKADLYVDGKSNVYPSILLGRADSAATLSAVALGSGSTSLSALQAVLGGTYVGPAQRLGDVDGDGFGDVALSVNASFGGTQVVVRGRANPPAILPPSGSILRVPTGALIRGAAGDQSGDGRPDLLISQSAQLSIASLPAGASSFSLAPVIGTLPDRTTLSETVGDLDGDGAIDLVLAGDASVLRFTHSGEAVKPRLQVQTEITRNGAGPRTDLPQTVSVTCGGQSQTRTGNTYDVATFGLDGSISSGDRCTVRTTQTLPSTGQYENCQWTRTVRFRGAVVQPDATVTVGSDPNLWQEFIDCYVAPIPPPEPEPTDFPTSFAGWKASGDVAGAFLTKGPAQTSSIVWPKPVNVKGKVINFTVTMNGGNGGAEGLTFAFLNNVAGQPAGGFIGAGGGQLGFGGLGGTALAFDVFKQAEDAQANTASWVDGVQGSSLRKLYSKDAGLRLRGGSYNVRVETSGGRLTATINGKFVHSVAATLPDSVFLAFTASTSASIWQWQSVSNLNIYDAA